MVGVGINTRIGAIQLRKKNGLSVALKAKFLFLWNGKFSGSNLLDDINGAVITVTDKDFTTNYIPGDSEATFAVPNTNPFLLADGGDDFWFIDFVLQQKTLADLIASTTVRSFIKYADFEPYNVSAIGILKAGESLTEEDKISLNRYFKLWVQYWGETMLESGYMKDNRTFIEI